MKLKAKKETATTFKLMANHWGQEHCILELTRLQTGEGTTIKAAGTLAMGMDEIRDVANALLRYAETGELKE